VRDGGRVQRILELREIQEQLQNHLYDVFELMREQNLNEEEQRAVGGIWLNRLLQPLADVRYRGNHSVFGIIDF
jgi:hypothetical protein